MKTHPAADIFPMMEESELQELANDIRENGQQETIKILDGQILDGRNRFKACHMAEVGPDTEEIECDDPLGYVLSLNIHRRHLTTSQRAMVAARMAHLKHGTNQYLPKTKGKEETQICVSSIDSAAKAMNVSPRSVDTAKKVLKESPEVAEEVATGKKTLNKAVTETVKPKRPAWKDAKLKAVKTGEAFIRAIDDLDELRPHKCRDEAVETAQESLGMVREW